jgi:hypothetical protein
VAVLIAVQNMKPDTFDKNSPREVRESSAMQKPRALALGHGVFYLITGVWPLVSMRTFEAVSGPKVDKWLVKTTGLLIAVIGATLLRASRKQHPGREIQILGIGTAASLAGVDFTYVAKGRIAPVYLFDAIAELGLAIGWAATVRGK